MDRLLLKFGESERGRILIVDDDMVLCKTISEGLASRGHLCDTAISGATALEALEQKPIDVLLTDIVLPDMNGLELTAKVKKMKPETAIIVTTGFIDEFSYEDSLLPSNA